MWFCPLLEADCSLPEHSLLLGLHGRSRQDSLPVRKECLFRKQKLMHVVL